MIRIVRHRFGEQLITHRRGAHRHPRMAGFRLFDGVDRKRTDRRNRQIFNRVVV
ncbi:hypothetical protein D1872_345920 [compost metagenome]